MADTLTLERDLAATLQLPRRELSRHREMLLPDLDWVTEGRTICYTEDGVTKMLGLLGLVDSVELPCEPEKMVAVVVNPDIRNPRLVLAERDGREVLVRVMPGTRGRYVRGMRIHVRRDGPGFAEASRPKRRGVESVIIG
jgi:hypothetical protein